jgi:drug/metabolite transporter (DMT)-like permease
MALGIALAFAQALAWAITSMILRNLSTRFDGFLVNGFRATVAMLIIVPLAFIFGSRADFQMLTLTRVLFLVGSIVIGGVIGDFLYIASLKSLGMVRAFPISNTQPLFTVLFSALILGEHISWPIVAGMVLVMFGIYLVARPRGQVQEDTAPLPKAQIIQGVLMALAAATLWGISAVVLAIGLKDSINPLVANSVRVPAVAFLGLGAATWRGNLTQLRGLSARTLGLLALAGVMGWAIGGMLFVTAVQLAGPSITSIIGSIAPLFAVPLCAIFLHERPTRHTMAGTAISVAGIVLVVLGNQLLALINRIV